MKFSLIPFLFLALLSQASISAAGAGPTFDYDNQGAWPGVCQTGRRQSPIDLTSPTSYKRILVDAVGLMKPVFRPHIENTARTVEYLFPDDNIQIKTMDFSNIWPRIKTYRVSNLHFHWGESEHAIDGQREALESHIVTYDTSFESIEEALGSRNSDAVLVLGTLYKTSTLPTLHNSLTMMKIASDVDEVVVAEAEHTSDIPLRLSGVIPNLLSATRFYTYAGSLTTPPCTQAVTFVIFREVIRINQSWLDSFLAVQDETGSPLGNNARDLQARNRRRIFRSTLF